MNKQQFLAAIRQRLQGLPENDIKKYLDYYSEMIEDRMEDGLSEEEAVASMESVETIVNQIFMETPLPKLVKASVKPKRSFRAWEIVLLILGFPLWFPLLIAAFAVILSFYIVLWSLILVLYAIVFALGATAISCILYGMAMPLSGLYAQAALTFGIGLVSAGLAILLFFAFNQVTKGLVHLSKIILRGIKSLFVKRSDQNE